MYVYIYTYIHMYAPSLTSRRPSHEQTIYAATKYSTYRGLVCLASGKTPQESAIFIFYMATFIFHFDVLGQEYKTPLS